MSDKQKMNKTKTVVSEVVGMENVLNCLFQRSMFVDSGYINVMCM